jgi:hypothetical protein
MDISALKNRLDTLNNAGKKQGTGEKIDYSQYFWKPQPGKHQIRIIPSKFNKAYPFREVFFHYGFSKGPVLSLSNWGEPDPIIEFSAKLKLTKDKDNYFLSKKIEPKMRVFVPVIVRGEEAKGVRLWEFGKEIYTTLLGIGSDEDYGDFTDVIEGRDFTIEADYKEVLGRRVISCNVRIKPKISPATEDANQLQKWLDEQPDILTINRKREYDDIKDLLAKWLNPEDNDSQTSTSESKPLSDTSVPQPFNAPTTSGVNTQKPNNFSLNTNPSDKFDELFN